MSDITKTLQYNQEMVRKLIVFLNAGSVTGNRIVLSELEILCIDYLLIEKGGVIVLVLPPDDGEKRTPNDAPGRYRLVESKRVDANKLYKFFETRVTKILAGQPV